MTTLALDTSFLVAALVEPHPRHGRCAPWIEALHAKEIRCELSTHALAETWAVLTRLPIDPPISPAAATLALERIASLMSVIELSRAHYGEASQRSAECTVNSGAVFDALHLVCAESTDADALVTFNPRDFERLVGPKSPPIVVPPDPPSLVLPAGQGERTGDGPRGLQDAGHFKRSVPRASVTTRWQPATGRGTSSGSRLNAPRPPRHPA